MTFSNEILKIENPIYAIRYNTFDNKSPECGINIEWDLTAKSVHSETGIFGVSINLKCWDERGGLGLYIRNFNRQDVLLYLLETSENYILTPQDTPYISSRNRVNDEELRKYVDQMNTPERIREFEQQTGMKYDHSITEFYAFSPAAKSYEICASRANIISIMPGGNIFQLLQAAVVNNLEHGRREGQGLEYELPPEQIITSM